MHESAGNLRRLFRFKAASHPSIPDWRETSSGHRPANARREGRRARMMAGTRRPAAIARHIAPLTSPPLTDCRTVDVC